MTKTTWTISELAQEFNITPRTIRFYEDHGIVNPKREGRNRIYATRDRTRLKLALRGRRLGLQLAEIVSLINLYNRSNNSTTKQLLHYAQVLEQHQAKLEQQKYDLDVTLREIKQQLDECNTLLKSRANKEAIPN